MSNYKQVTNIGIETVSSSAHTNETLKELKDNYNLKKVSGNMYEEDDAYVNNI